MRKTAVTLLLATAAAQAAQASQPDSLYESMANKFLTAYGHESTPPDEFNLEEFLNASFVKTQLGLFDVYMPAQALKAETSREDYVEITRALARMQETWLGWLEAGETEGIESAQEDLATIQNWLEDWKQSDFDGAAPGATATLLEADPEVQAALSRFASYMAKGQPLGLQRMEELREPIVLMPERGQFVEFICVGAWMYPHLQGSLWQPGIATWTNFYLDRVKILALEYANPSGSLANYTASFDMNYASKTGKQQQIVQLTTNSLIDNYFGERIPPALAGSLAVNMVIELFGECNTRADGDLRERRTSAVEIFVPGGNPSGGTLAKNDANSRWRADMGSKHFVSVLRNSQKRGSKAMRRSKAKNVHFELVDDSGSKQETISGPYLGSKAKDFESTPEAFGGDQIEFLRAYRSCFMWWLQENGAGKEKASRKAFATLLTSLAHNEDPHKIENVFEASFGKPLSNEDADKKSLEGRFVAWLSKRK